MVIGQQSFIIYSWTNTNYNFIPTTYKHQNWFNIKLKTSRRKNKRKKNKPTDVNVVNRQITKEKLNKNEMVDYNFRKYYIILYRSAIIHLYFLFGRSVITYWLLDWQQVKIQLSIFHSINQNTLRKSHKYNYFTFVHNE